MNPGVHITLLMVEPLSSNETYCNLTARKLSQDSLSHLSHLFRRFLGSRVDVSNHDEPALSLSVAHSGRMLFSFKSCFILSIHLSLGLPLGRDPGT